MSSSEERSVTRRDVLQILAALGITGPLAVDLAAQAAPRVSEQTLASAASLLSGSFDEARLKVAQTALQRNLDQFQVVRDLEVADDIEPPTIFLPRR